MAPRGLVRLAVPMTFGVKAVAPILPEFLAAYPEVSIDLHLSDATVDLIGEGFDAGLRIARLPDSSLIARRLCAMPRYTVAAPSYLKRHGRPTHPMHLAEHKCFGYAYLSTPGVWHYTNASGEQASVRPAGQLRVNNGEALLPSRHRRPRHRRPAGLHRRRRHRIGRSRGDPERLAPARRRRASGHPARRPATCARGSAGGFSGASILRRRRSGEVSGGWAKRSVPTIDTHRRKWAESTRRATKATRDGGHAALCPPDGLRLGCAPITKTKTPGRHPP